LRLRSWATGEVTAGVAHGGAASSRPKVAFVFSGQGAQQPGMGRALYDQEPAFRTALDECDELLRPHLPRPRREVLFPARPAVAEFVHRTGWTQPALFALEYALAQQWRAWGLEPSAVAGHSIGELVAACVADVLDLGDALRLIAARARLMGALP